MCSDFRWTNSYQGLLGRVSHYAEIPPPLQQNIILLSKNEIKYLLAHLKCGVVKKIVLWNSNYNPRATPSGYNFEFSRTKGRGGCLGKKSESNNYIPFGDVVKNL
jgi:hypothetical protein